MHLVVVAHDVATDVVERAARLHAGDQEEHGVDAAFGVRELLADAVVVDAEARAYCGPEFGDRFGPETLCERLHLGRRLASERIVVKGAETVRHRRVDARVHGRPVRAAPGVLVKVEDDAQLAHAGAPQTRSSAGIPADG